MSADEGRWLEGLDERTERERMEAAQPSASQPDGLAEAVAYQMFVLGVTSPNRRIWPLDEDYRQSLANNLMPAVRAHLADLLTGPEAVDRVGAALWVSLLGKHRRGDFAECPPQHIAWWRDQATAALAAVRALLTGEAER